jgi:hypothetical protein
MAGVLIRRGGVTPGCVVTIGAGTCGVGGMARATDGAGTGRCGKLASSEIFCVGATRGPVVPSRAPQPPQNRESGAFSVPQLAQRIPSQA